MAVRRLLVVMLVLLGVSTLAAALVPPQSGQDDTGSTASEQTVPADTLPRGKTLSAEIRVGGGKTPVVPVEVGDQLELTVRSERSDLLEIPGLGLVEAVAPGSPARFNVLALERGSYGIRFVERDHVVARIVVERAGAGKKEEAGSSKASSRARGE